MKSNDIKKLKIINELLKHGHVTRACERSNVKRITYYSWLKNDKNFAKEVESARKDAMA